MKFSTSSILCLVALVAATILSSSGQVSARNNDGPSSFGKKVLKKNKSSKAESSTLPLSSMEESSMEKSLLTLYGLNRSVPLTKDEATFLEEVIQDAYNKVHEETDDGYSAKSVLIEGDFIDDQSTRSLLRGSSNNNRTLVSDVEMCDDKWGVPIPNCTHDIDFFIDPYCNNCKTDDEPNMTREPSSVPSLPPTLTPTLDPCNDPNNLNDGNGNACLNDDDSNSGSYMRMTREPSSVPSSPPTLPPTGDPCNDPNNLNDGNGNACLNDDDSRSGSYMRMTREPTVPSRPPTLPPTRVVAEESPTGPYIHPPPPSSYFDPSYFDRTISPTVSPTVDPVAELIRKRLKKQRRFRRFWKVWNVGVGGN